MRMDEFYQGSCLCGAVTYEVSAPLKAVSHCHCAKCRKAHGAAFATYASAPRSAVSVASRVDALRRFQSSAGVTRQFCSICGTSLFWSDANGEFADWISIAVGTLDTPFDALKQRHTCVTEKAPWFEIEDRWPQEG